MPYRFLIATTCNLSIAAYLLLGGAAHAIERQYATNWCWAAAVQDVVAQAGIFTTQAEVSARLTGWPQDRPAQIPEVVMLVRSYGLSAHQAGRVATLQELSGTLASGNKIIAFVAPGAGPVGHFIVLEGLDWHGNVIVSDPSNGSTVPTPPATLYYQWRWIDSVVVRPR